MSNAELLDAISDSHDMNIIFIIIYIHSQAKRVIYISWSESLKKISIITIPVSAMSILDQWYTLIIYLVLSGYPAFLIDKRDTLN